MAEVKAIKRYGRVCADDGVRSLDVRSRDVPEYVKRTSKSKAGYAYEETSTRATVCDRHAEERWSEWKAPVS